MQMYLRLPAEPNLLKFSPLATLCCMLLNISFIKKYITMYSDRMHLLMPIGHPSSKSYNNFERGPCGPLWHYKVNGTQPKKIFINEDRSLKASIELHLDQWTNFNFRLFLVDLPPPTTPKAPWGGRGVVKIETPQNRNEIETNRLQKLIPCVFLQIC